MNTTTNQSAITVITGTVSFLAAVCVSMLCFLAYKGMQIPPELNTITGTLCGYLTGTLVKTSPTETLKAPAASVSGKPIQAEIINKKTDPVKTSEVKS